MLHGWLRQGRVVRAALCVAALPGALLVAGCGGSGSDSTSTSASTGSTGTTSDGKAAKIAYLSYTIADYQTAMVQGMKEKVGPDGGSVTTFNAQFDPSKQTQQCQDAVTSGRYNAIVIAPVTPATAVPCATAAHAAGVPVINLEFPIGKDLNAVDPTVPGNVKSIVTQPATNSRALADLVKLACANTDPCEVVAEVATANDPLTTDAANEVAKVPGVEVVQRIATQYDPSMFAKSLGDALSAHPGIDVVVAAADFGALAVVPVLKQAGKLGSIKLVGNGASRSGVAAVKDGTLFGTLGTWPLQMGQLAGTAAMEAVNGKTPSPAGVNGYEIDTPLLVTKKTVDQMKPEWGASS